MIKNAKERLLQQMQKYNEPGWLPASDEVHIFLVLTDAIFAYDPIGIQNALDFDFPFESIYDEYDIEAAELMRCKAKWSDPPTLGHAIKDVLDHYFYEDYPLEDCLFLAEKAMLAIEDNRVLLDVDAINDFMSQRRHKWIPITID